MVYYSGRAVPCCLQVLPKAQASSPGWRAAACESGSCTWTCLVSLLPLQPGARTLSSPQLCSSVKQQQCLTVNWLGLLTVLLAFSLVYTHAFSLNRRDILLHTHTHAHTSFCMSFLSSWIKSRAAKLPVLCHVTLIASRSHHILNSCGFSEAIYLMQFAKCLRSSADSDILGLQSFAI